MFYSLDSNVVNSEIITISNSTIKSDLTLLSHLQKEIIVYKLLMYLLFLSEESYYELTIQSLTMCLVFNVFSIFTGRFMASIVGIQWPDTQ